MASPANFRDYKVRRWHAEFDWTAQSGAVSYEIYKDNELHGTSGTTSYVATNLLENTNHIFKIRSVFENGSKSEFSYEINVRTGLYPAERTVFSTIPYVADPFPVNRNSVTNSFGLFEKPITNDAGYPRGNKSDYFSYPKLATFTSDGAYMGTDNPFDFWNTVDFSKDATRSSWSHGQYYSLVQSTPHRSYWNSAGPSFLEYNSGSNTFTRTFNSLDAPGNLLPTSEDGGPSWDDRLWAFQGKKSGTGNWVILYNRIDNSIVAEFDSGVNVEGGWVSVSPKGNYLIVARQPSSGQRFLDIYAINTSSVTYLNRHNVMFGHADLGISMQGNEVMVYRDNGLKMMRLDNGEVTSLIGDSTTNGWFSVGHVSCKNVQQPGWAYVNSNETATYSGLTNSTIRKLSYRKIIGVKLDENSTGDGSTIFREYGILSTPSPDNQGYTTPSPDGRMLASNKYYSTTWLGVFLQQQNLLGDEIPFVQIPIITLTGASTINLNVGDTYTELGATATDAEDGTLTEDIVVTGTVNTAVAGTYYKYYNVTDSDSNAAVQVVRIIIVSEPGPVSNRKGVHKNLFWSI